jgi:hypothetical protein
LRRHFTHKAGGVFEHFQRLLEIDNIDTVTFPEDILFHLRIPALGLVPEVNAGFEQFLHRDYWQTASLKLSEGIASLLRRSRRTVQSEICTPRAIVNV